MSTPTTRVGLTKPDLGEQSWGPKLNANLDTLDAVDSISGLITTASETPSTTLRVKVWSGSFVNAAGTRVDYAGGLITIAASSTVLIWLTDAGVLTSGASYPGTA